MRDRTVLSVIVPTCNRRDLVLEAVSTIAAARRPGPCEIVVVVDGSTDGTAGALRAQGLARVVEQPNRGAAAARNAGAAVATGRFLLFLDDDMTADPDLLVSHVHELSAGADAVVGAIDLDPRSPRTLLSRGVRRWAEQRRARLARSGGVPGVEDFLTGQLGVRADWFARTGGFDATLTRDGSFGGEDTDFVHRLLLAGGRLRFRPDAVSHQRYLVTAGQNIRQWEQAGRSDAVLARKHPGLGAALHAGHHGDRVDGVLTRALSALPEPALRGVRDRVVRRVDRGRMDRATEVAYAKLRDVAYWRGARGAGGLDPSGDTGVRLLAYHAVADVTDPLLARWSVPPQLFAAQIEAVLAAGHTVITADDLLAHLDGRPLRPGSVLLTFDDAYRSLLTGAQPVLARHGLTGTVCVVTDQIGGHNAWDTARGATRLPLLDAGELRDLRDSGWEIASHSRRHAHLTALRGAAIEDDLRHSRRVLARLGLGDARLVAYPHGEHDRRVRDRARAAGFAAGLALTTRAAAPDRRARFAVPRIEVQRGTTPAELLRRLATPHRHPAGTALRHEVRALATLIEGVRK